MAPVKKGGPGGIRKARVAIGRIDANLLRLLNRRAAIVAGLHARKARDGTPIYDAARTDTILERVLRLNKGPLRDEQVLALFAFLLHHFALGHRPSRPPEPPLFVAEPVPGSDLAAVRRTCDRHGLRLSVGGKGKRVDAASRTAPLALAEGAILRISGKEDDEALADLCYRAKLFWLALRPLRTGGKR